MPRMARVIVPNLPHYIVQRDHNRNAVFIKLMPLENKCVPFIASPLSYAAIPKPKIAVPDGRLSIILFAERIDHRSRIFF